MMEVGRGDWTAEGTGFTDERIFRPYNIKPTPALCFQSARKRRRRRHHGQYSTRPLWAYSHPINERNVDASAVLGQLLKPSE
jgi:hypothetical protein